MPDYVHGHETSERQRLRDQGELLAELLFDDGDFSESEHILEVGCGVGVQTENISRRQPSAKITSVDVSEAYIRDARRNLERAGITNVELHHADAMGLPFKEATFDHVFVCFVLEHLPDPQQFLATARRLLRPGGHLTVIEGDHGSAYFHPSGVLAQKLIECQVELQAKAGGDARIGRRLFPMIVQAGFHKTRVSPRSVYVDGSRPKWIEGFTINTFTAMIKGIERPAIDTGLVSQEEFDQGIEELLRTSEADGTFNYTFFKATAER
ncbi:MAG: methyltransferase domain-containing protein [Pseudomonadota bacterium]